MRASSHASKHVRSSSFSRLTPEVTSRQKIRFGAPSFVGDRRQEGADVLVLACAQLPRNVTFGDPCPSSGGAAVLLQERLVIAFFADRTQLSSRLTALVIGGSGFHEGAEPEEGVEHPIARIPMTTISERHTDPELWNAANGFSTRSTRATLTAADASSTPAPLSRPRIGLRGDGLGCNQDRPMGEVQSVGVCARAYQPWVSEE